MVYTKKKCNTCIKAYVGQSGRPIIVIIRYKEHTRYIINNNHASVYATRILSNKHEYGETKDILKLIKPCRKGTKMNYW